MENIKNEKGESIETPDSYIERSLDLYRMENSVLSPENMDGLYNITGNHIAATIITAICYDHQHDVFGFGTFDPQKFGEKYGFSMQYLLAQHKKPYQNTVKFITEKKTNDNRVRENKGQELYTNNLENALFVLSTYPLKVMTTVYEDKKRIVHTYRPIRIFREFSREFDKVTGKVTYSYEVDEDFRRSFATYYLTSNQTSQTRLRKSDLVLFYQFLLRLRDALFLKNLTSTPIADAPNFSYMVQMARINKDLKPANQKQKLNKAIKKVLDETELDFSVEWVAYKDEKEKYRPIIHFYPKLGDILGNDNLAIKARRREEKIDVTCTEFKILLTKKCPYRNPKYRERANELFFEWIKTDTEEQKALLYDTFYTTFQNVGCTTVPKDIRARVEHFIWAANSKSPDKFDSYVQECIISDKFKFWDYFSSPEEFKTKNYSSKDK